MNIGLNSNNLNIDISELQQDISINSTNVSAEIEQNVLEITNGTKKMSIETGITKIAPRLEDLEITPTMEEQNFKSKKDGYDNVKVKAIPEEYVVPKVIEKTLVLSRVKIDEGRLIV